MESLEELLSGCVGGFLFLGIELTILVGIEPFEELGAFVAFFLAGFVKVADCVFRFATGSPHPSAARAKQLRCEPLNNLITACAAKLVEID